MGSPPRLLLIQLLTDFGDPVSQAGNEGPWDSEGPKGWDSGGGMVPAHMLAQVTVSLGLAAAEDLTTPTPSAAALLRVWQDRNGTVPLDPQHLPVSHDSTCKVWVSLDASSLKVARDVDGVWLRLCGTTLCASGCPLPGPSRCAGGLLAMSVSVLVLFADGDCRPGPCMHNPGLGQVLPLFSSAFRVDLEGSQRSSSEHMPASFSYLVRVLHFPASSSPDATPARRPVGDAATAGTTGRCVLAGHEPRGDGTHEYAVGNAGCTEDGVLGDLRVVVYEDSKARGTGGSIWDVSLILTHLLVRTYLGQGGSGRVRGMEGMDVIEVGAGTGVPGLVCVALGARVTLTDTASDVLKLLDMNLEANHALKGCGVQRRGEGRVAALTWKADPQLQRHRKLGEGSDDEEGGAGVELIVASEVAYSEEGIAPLVVTLRALAGPRTRVLLGFRNRDAVVELRLRALLGAFFAAERVTPQALHGLPAFCMQENVEIYWATLLKDANDLVQVICAQIHPSTLVLTCVWSFSAHQHGKLRAWWTHIKHETPAHPCLRWQVAKRLRAQEGGAQAVYLLRKLLPDFPSS